MQLRNPKGSADTNDEPTVEVLVELHQTQTKYTTGSGVERLEIQLPMISRLYFPLSYHSHFEAKINQAWARTTNSD